MLILFDFEIMHGESLVSEIMWLKIFKKSGLIAKCHKLIWFIASEKLLECIHRK